MKKIKIDDWKPFEIEKLFTVKRPKSRSVKKYNEGEIPFVSSGNYNNGVDSYREPIDDEDLDKGNCITVSPVDGSTFYQPQDFLGRGGGGSSIMLLYNDNLNKFNGLFIASVIRESLKIKYQYNDMGSSDSIKKENILLPALDDKTPDWNFMEESMKRLETRERESTSNLTSYLKNAKLNKVDTSKWKEFDVMDFFSPITVKNKVMIYDIKNFGTTPVYASDSSYKNNIGYIDDEPEFYVNDEQSMYVIFGDHTKSMRIIETNFSVTDNVKVLSPKIKSKNSLFFVMTSWLANIPDLGYSRHWSIAKKTKIKLPVKSDNSPDWEYMERYIENLKLKCNIANYNI
ncbi:MAG: restriction endonuclease subunit S [Lactobacillus iners]|nr:restriction endonuclease subunit S [Lactobacillus iners]